MLHPTLPPRGPFLARIVYNRGPELGHGSWLSKFLLQALYPSSFVEG